MMFPTSALVILLLVLVAWANAQCSPSPCGANTDCQVEGGRAVCGCKPGYIGNAISGCKRECEKDADCAANMGCLNYRCRDPCRNGCGDYATCQVVNHQAICKCDSDFGGDPYKRCIPECTSHEECPSHLACIGRRCGNPCKENNPCLAKSRYSDCRMEKHTVICVCKSGYYGEPLTTGCRKVSG